MLKSLRLADFCWTMFSGKGKVGVLHAEAFLTLTLLILSDPSVRLLLSCLWSFLSWLALSFAVQEFSLKLLQFEPCNRSLQILCQASSPFLFEISLKISTLVDLKVRGKRACENLARQDIFFSCSRDGILRIFLVSSLIFFG